MNVRLRRRRSARLVVVISRCAEGRETSSRIVDIVFGVEDDGPATGEGVVVRVELVRLEEQSGEDGRHSEVLPIREVYRCRRHRWSIDPRGDWVGR